MDPVQLYLESAGKDFEFEARFPKITKAGYQSILRRLAGKGFTPVKEFKLLRITAGEIRAEVHDIVAINAYCARESPLMITAFTRKTVKAEKRNKYGIKMVLSHEKPIPKEEVTAVRDGFAGQSKHFRLIHRVTFMNPDMPAFKVDCSVIKMSQRNSKTFATSDAMGQPDHCEVEIEAVARPPPDVFKGMLAKVCTLVLAGIQNTSFPIPIEEMDNVVASYSALTRSVDVHPTSRRFIGYNSVTLQASNLIEETASVLTDYVVSSKADGVRRLLYINPSGWAYFLSPVMAVESTNVKVPLRNTILDGEFVESGKDGLLNLFIAFDVYFENGEDLRRTTFSQRLERLDHLVSKLSTLNITTKPTFKGNVFEACRACLAQVFPYDTDGIIFTPDRPVADPKDPPNQLITWDMSFKWKPPAFNSIDFQVFVAHTLPDYVSLNLCVITSGQWGNPFETVLQLTEGQPQVDQGVHQFIGDEAAISNVALIDGKMLTVKGDIIQEGMIVEFIFNPAERPGWQWIPLRTRPDKLKPNHTSTAYNNWTTICHPITEQMIVGDAPVKDGRYYVGDKNRTTLRNFHNHVKAAILTAVCKFGDTLIDFATGKGGDLHKWRSAKLGFVFGLDVCSDNILNMSDGACVRYLSTVTKSNLLCLFAVADCSKPLQGTRDIDRLVISSVLGETAREDIPPKYHNLLLHWNMQFNVSAAMFAVHYMHQDKQALYAFAQNVAKCTKLNGFFVGATWDGSLVFDLLAALPKGGTWSKNDVRVVKQYTQEAFAADESSLGMTIDVFQSTFTYSKEYLVNFDYFTEVMTQHGFRLRNSKHFNQYDHASFGLSDADKELSFLNRSFIFEHVQLVETGFSVVKVGTMTL